MKKNPVVHFEMPYKDAQRVSDFYSKAFGWGMQTFAQMGNYVVAATSETDANGQTTTPGTIGGGFYDQSQAPTAGTTVVISVDNLEESMKQVTAAGGKVLGTPMDIPTIGKYVAVEDTEGNRVGMLQPMAMV